MSKQNIITVIIVIIAFIILNKACEGNTKTITKTKIEYVPIKEEVTKTVIDTVYKKVYVEKTKTIKGKDTVIYKDKPSETTIKANQYKAKIESNNASADLEITTTGELLDVQGIINYNQKQTTTETLKIRDASGFYIYANMPINSVQPELGVLYQFKNKIFVSAGAQLNEYTKSADLKVGLGIKIF